MRESSGDAGGVEELNFVPSSSEFFKQEIRVPGSGYANGIRRYISMYLECNINPIVIFDGGYDKSDRKLRNTISRSKNRLSNVQYIAKHGYCSGRILPILAYEVFYSVLTELNVPFAQCDYEADDQITALANHYKCPVISGDSDFYIFDIHNGFIHHNSLDTTITVGVDSDEKEYKYLDCNIYYIEKFVSYFPGLDKKALPLFGTLIGNDFVQGSQFKNFFSNIQLPKYKGRKLILNPKQKKMMGLLCWLQHNTLDKAVDEIIAFLKKERREHMKSVIENSVDGYRLNHCNLSLVIDKNVNELKTGLHSNSRLLTPCKNGLPIEFTVGFHQGVFPVFFINVIALHRVFLQPQVESMSFSSSYSCSLYIRKILYGILVRHGSCENTACLSPIEEYDRQRNSFKKELVNPIFTVEGFGILPKLDELSDLPKEKCHEIFSKILDIQPDLFLNVPDEWKLYIACVNYWLRKCEPHSSQAFIYSLILNLIYFHLIKSKTHLNKTKLCNNTGKELKCSCSKICCILSYINESELRNADKNLEKYTHKPPFNHGNPLLLNIVHSCSQLQTCILYITYLNKLLGNIMKNPSFEMCFSGTMLYNVAKDISSRSNPELFVAEILGRDSNLHSLFLQLNLNICENLPNDCILKDISSHKKKKKSKKNRDSSNSNIEAAHSSNKFDILNSSDLEL